MIKTDTSALTISKVYKRLKFACCAFGWYQPYLLLREICLKKLLCCLLACTLFMNVYASSADDAAALLQTVNEQEPVRSDSIWQRVIKGFMLNHKETADVRYWQARYSNPRFFYAVINNAAPYLYFVLIETERRGFPSELVFIPVIESSYNPKAKAAHEVSTGMWQFEHAAMVRFGMQHTTSLDERMDVIKSTKSAMSYFQYLYALFGTWETAIAAYNWGEGNIYNATVQAGSKDFYDLKTRDITKQYIAKLIALATIIDDPARFGLRLPHIPNQPYLMIVQPNDTYTVKEFIHKLKINHELFHNFNPQFKNDSMLVTTDSSVLVPYDVAEKYFMDTEGKVNKGKQNIDAILSRIDMVNEDMQKNPVIEPTEDDSDDNVSDTDQPQQLKGKKNPQGSNNTSGQKKNLQTETQKSAEDNTSQTPDNQNQTSNQVTSKPVDSATSIDKLLQDQ